MKQFMNYAFLSAIAFAGALGFSSCSDENAVVAENNPNYNPETGEVNVNFVFNVSTANEPTTRMSAANTQANTDQQFRGINNAYLGIFKLDADGKIVKDHTSAPTKIHSFGTIIQKGGLSLATTDDKPASRRVVELALPTETNTLMFWGKAIKDGTDMDQGRIDMNVSTTDLSATSFKLCKIVPEEAYEGAPHVTQEALLQHEQLMAIVLTQIIRSNITNLPVTYDGTTKSMTVKWSDYVDVTGESESYTLKARQYEPFKDGDNNIPISALGEKLMKAFLTLNTIRANELRAGSGRAVSKMVNDLMAIVNSVVGADPVSFQEKVAIEVAKQIKTNVEKFFDKDYEYKWLSGETVKTNSNHTEFDKVLADCDFNAFPTTFNLPRGSVVLQFDIALADTSDPSKGYTFTYNYKGAVQTYAMGGSTSSFDPLNYVYPAELCYFGNSPIRVSDVTKAANDYPDGAANWDAASSWDANEWTVDKHVLASTRSVAMRDNINYGTALFETKVKYGAATLQDNYGNLDKLWNNKTEVTEQNNTIDVTQNNTHFVLTGVLIGGQEAEVGWNYIAKSSDPGWGNMVYDKVKSVVNEVEEPYIEIPKYDSNSTSQTPSVSNYTLVWDNWEQHSDPTAKQRDVYVALEFTNNSRDFYGENNLIRNGATFYIVGKLDPDKRPASMTDKTDTEYAADKSLGITWPEKYALPPYDADGKTIKERRIFIQDYLTSATFVMGENSLQHALVSVPDLRSGQISLGLSVDISWRTGLSFNEVILGAQ